MELTEIKYNEIEQYICYENIENLDIKRGFDVHDFEGEIITENLYFDDEDI